MLPAWSPVIALLSAVCVSSMHDIVGGVKLMNTRFINELYANARRKPRFPMDSIEIIHDAVRFHYSGTYAYKNARPGN